MVLLCALVGVATGAFLAILWFSYKTLKEVLSWAEKPESDFVPGFVAGDDNSKQVQKRIKELDKDAEYLMKRFREDLIRYPNTAKTCHKKAVLLMGASNRLKSGMSLEDVEQWLLESLVRV